MKYEALIPVLRREIPMKAHAHRADDIFTAIRIAKEFNLRMTIDHCTDGALIADILAEEGYPAFVGPTSGGTPTKHEVMNRSFETPAILHKAGVPFAIITDDPVITIEALPFARALPCATDCRRRKMEGHNHLFRHIYRHWRARRQP